MLSLTYYCLAVLAIQLGDMRLNMFQVSGSSMAAMTPVKQKQAGGKSTDS